MRRLMRAALAGLFAVAAACSSAAPGGGEAPAPTLWTYADLAWYKFLNKVSMNATVGPIVVGQTVLYGGTYGFDASTLGESRTSRLALLDAATGQARWRIEYSGTWGPLVLDGGAIVVAVDDKVLGLDFATGVQRWQAPLRARTLTAAGGVVLVAVRGMLHALDAASGAERWRARADTDPVAADDTALFMDGRTLRGVAAATGEARWSLELPPALAYPYSARGGHLYLIGASSLGSVSLTGRRLEWVAPLASAPVGGLTAAEDTLYFTTQAPSGHVFHAFDPATQRDRWSRALDAGPRVAPVVMGGLVATPSNAAAESLIALSRETGAVAWQGRAGAVPVQPVLGGNVLYVAGQGPNRIYAFDAGTGAVRWSGRLWGWPMGMALTGEGALLVGADNLTLYAYRTN